MATPLDTGLLSNFGVIFPFLLVFCLMYAVFIKTDIFGDNKGLAAIISFALGIMTLFFPIIRESINVMAPWFVLFIFAISFILLGFMMFGASESDILSVLRTKEHGYLNTWIAGLGLLIVFGSLTSVVSDFGGVGETADGGVEVNIGDDGTQESAFWDTFVHPDVLGMVLILLIGAFTVSRLASKP
ncbi:MAG: hypothetical protein QF632_01005 [Candidatus Woesearchaeota archaeon]|jgi:hypothetical protein|nr:hypothetical protein [Candidatus Woesearchaeota archaeon]MDP7323320.1 hypothetical protein [Candidatus Woesearchaeota archaeon]MDP7458504.1 hypothetical protein [Candidatus Woesearchaeota archaeon]